MSKNTCKNTADFSKNSLKEQEEKALEEVKIARVREQLAGLVYDADWQKFQSQKTLDFTIEYLNAQYDEVDEKEKHSTKAHAESAKQLEKTREFMFKGWRAAQERYKMLSNIFQSAVPQYASRADAVFLTGLMTNGEYDLNEKNAQRFKKLFEDKVERMKMDKKRYEALSKHPMAKKPAVLKLQSKIKLNNSSSFFAVTVKERRPFLKAVEDAVDQESVLQAYREKSADKMSDLYTARLKRMRDRRIIGKVTFEAYNNEFQKMSELYKSDPNEFTMARMKKWHELFDEQMAPRLEFWQNQVRKKLYGPGRDKMEAVLDKMGLKKAKAYLENVIKPAEILRLKGEYMPELYKHAHGKVGEDKVIGQVTVKKYEAWFGPDQPLSVLYFAKDKIPEQMQRYRALWAEAKTLPKVHQETLKGLIDKLGYSKLRKKLDELKQAPVTDENPADALLKKARNSSTRQAIAQAGMILGRGDKMNAFISFLDRLTQQKTRQQMDEVVHEEGTPNSIITDPVEQTPVDEPELFDIPPSDPSDAPVSRADRIQAQLRLVSSKPSRRPKLSNEPKIPPTTTPKNAELRRINVVVNDVGSMANFASTNSKSAILMNKGNDDVSMHIKTNNGVERMNGADLLLMRDYLKQCRIMQ